MMEYLKWLPLLTVIARHPHSVQALQDSIPDVERIASRFQPYTEDVQALISELTSVVRQIQGLPPVVAHALTLVDAITQEKSQ